MRARPDPTQLERLSDASFLGKLLVSPANVRLYWKVIARYKCSSLFGLIISNEGNKFYKIDTRATPKLCFMLRRDQRLSLWPLPTGTTGSVYTCDFKVMLSVMFLYFLHCNAECCMLNDIILLALVFH